MKDLVKRDSAFSARGIFHYAVSPAWWHGVFTQASTL